MAEALSPLRGHLEALAASAPVHVAGGPVRDWILGRPVADLDLVIPEDAIGLARRFADTARGHFVLLDVEEGVARVITPEGILDFSQYRKGARTLADDLRQRDFTINAMALPLDAALELPALTGAPVPGNAPIMQRLMNEKLADPLEGLSDLRQGVIRIIGRDNLLDDPLRLLRAYRFRAQLDFQMDVTTEGWIRELSGRILSVSPERIAYECQLILATARAARSLAEMAQTRLLMAVLPEMAPAEGVEQPGFHHLDVLGHSLAAVEAVEALLADPCAKFPLCEPLDAWRRGQGASHLCALKWAALLHDVGKPACREERDGRATFYHHDFAGADMAAAAGRRLRWPRRETAWIARMIRLHMRPFHLLNDLRVGGPSPRALRRLLKETEADYPALFLLAMADSMAGLGPLKPEELDRELAELWARVHRFYLETLQPVEAQPRLLNGHDIRVLFELPEGPLIGQALEALAEARVAGEISSRQEAIDWLHVWFKSEGDG